MEPMDDSEFECETCGTMFRTMVYEIMKAFEKVNYAENDWPEVDVQCSENVANFCTKRCRDASLVVVLARDGVPVRRVGIEPIEPCAKCGGPVDMSDFHLTYTEQDVEFHGFIGTPKDVDYLAVLCRNCAPMSSEEAESASLADLPEGSSLTSG